ncbi:dephospho-CoA kinase [Gilvibacter sediminis]|uniref:dephospho-CoA kinase n=1 Tax=Gilvibacter sediminis TaxID=379071 RepID=UPI0023505FE4|nr:dephospho-CoA kinase [Gilvibacter sediminis]MDC7997852.1 dephospho-CoA kinase [Gilvibacter sediminis]
MISIGLTGGIGSGKSTVAGFFEELGIPIYYADDRAKSLMVENQELIASIKALLGDQAYTDDGRLNRAYIASQVFSDAELLESLNALVHPAVGKDFSTWAQAQHSPYVIKEAAILFENGSYTRSDATILVTAPENIRLQRVMNRDGASEEAVRARMQHQWPDEQKIPLADYVIENIDLEATRKQVISLHEQLISLKK